MREREGSTLWGEARKERARAQEEGRPLGRPPLPSVAAATSGMTGPFTGGSWRSPVAQRTTSAVNLEPGHRLHGDGCPLLVSTTCRCST